MEAIHIKRGFVESKVDANYSTAAFANQTKAKKRRNKKAGLPYHKRETSIEKSRNLRSRNRSVHRLIYLPYYPLYTTHPEHPSKTAGEQRHEVPYAACASGTQSHTPTPF